VFGVARERGMGRHAKRGMGQGVGTLDSAPPGLVGAVVARDMVYAACTP
jgi:hypothetical protein